MHDVGALERHVAAQPRRGADVEVARRSPRWRRRPPRRRWCRRCPRRRAPRRAARARRRRRAARCRPRSRGAPARAAGAGRGRSVAPGPGPRRTADGSRLSVHQRSTAVSQPATARPGEPHREVLGHVEQPGRGGIHLRPLVAQPRRLAHRVLAGAGRHAARSWTASAAGPARCSRPGTRRPPPVQLLGVAGAARVHPGQRRVHVPAVARRPAPARPTGCSCRWR